MGWFSSNTPPAFKDTRVRRGHLDVLVQVNAATGVAPAVLDTNFTPISHDWFFDKRTQKALCKHFFGLPRYTSEAWDCENFGTELVQWICRQAALAGVPACPLAFVFCVTNLKPWAGVADGYHALNLIETDKGFVVIEPQSIQRFMISAPLAEYPNEAFKIYT